MLNKAASAAPSAPATHAPRLVYPRRAFRRDAGAIGLIEVDGMVPYTAAAKCILDKHDVGFCKPLMLGSGTGTLMIAGSVAEVRGATDPAWLMSHGVLGKYYKQRPLIGTMCFERPSESLLDTTFALDPVEDPPAPFFMVEQELTLVVFETLRAGPYFRALEFVGNYMGDGGLFSIGNYNMGSKHRSFMYAGEQGLAFDTAKMAAKAYIRKLTDEGKLAGLYDGSWGFNLRRELNEDLVFVLPWPGNPNMLPAKKAPKGFSSPFSGRMRRNLPSFFVETEGVGPSLQAVDAAAKKANMVFLAPELLGSATRTIWGVSPTEEDVNQAAAEVMRLNAQKLLGVNVAGGNTLINAFVIEQPKSLLAEKMAALEPITPRFDIPEGSALAVFDVTMRGTLYNVAHVLRGHPGVQVVGTSKEGSERDSLTVAGPQAEVEAAIADVKRTVPEECKKQGRSGQLFAITVIVEPHEEALRSLQWQKRAKYLAEAPEGRLLSTPYYQYDEESGRPPFANVEVRGLAQGLVIANAVLHEDVVPVSRYSVGASLVDLHFTAEDYELLLRVFDWNNLLRICQDMPNTYSSEDGLDRMLLNTETYANPGPIWDIIDHQTPVQAEAMARLANDDAAVGVVTVRGMIPTFYFLDQLKNYGVELWGMEKSGGQHMTIAIYGSLAQVRAAVSGNDSKPGNPEGIIGNMLELQGQLDPRMAEVMKDEANKELRQYGYGDYRMLSGQTRTWAVIGRPHRNLVFFLPRGLRVGV